MTDPNAGDATDRLDPGGALELRTFERLFHEHVSPLTRFVYSYVKSWEAAEDIVHNVFLQLWLRHRNLEPVRDLAAYLYTVARYDALDHLRHQGIEAQHRQVTAEQGEAVLWLNAEHELLADEVAAALHRAIDALPGRQRDILLLRLERQASYHEIAERLKISPKTVDAHLQRAFAKLRKVLPRLLG